MMNGYKEIKNKWIKRKERVFPLSFHEYLID